MKRLTMTGGLALVLAGVLHAPAALAQDGREDLMTLGTGALNQAIDMRYDAALAMTRDAAVIGANDTRYLWASQAKVQCGIAHGYLRSGHKDPVSIGKCDDAWRRMQLIPAPMAPPPQVVSTVTPELCSNKVAGTVFFDFDSATPPENAAQTLDFVATNMAPCGWRQLTVTGHTDRSGSDAYNQALSQRRAEAIAGQLGARGIPGSALVVSGRGESEPRVPTADGVRELQNRRVEITVN